MKPIIFDDRMNKAETRYAQHLELSRRAGTIVAWRFEPIKLCLGVKTWYTPDFLVVGHDSFAFHEFKGFWRDDARVKIKTAASLYPWFRFVAVTEERGQYVWEEFASRSLVPDARARGRG